MKTLKPKIHGILADLSAARIFVSPFLLDLDSDGPVALSPSVAGNVSLIVYNLLTNYSYNTFKFTPLNAHLILDSLTGFAFVTAPFLIGFQGIAKYTRKPFSHSSNQVCALPQISVFYLCVNTALPRRFG